MAESQKLAQQQKMVGTPLSVKAADEFVTARKEYLAKVTAQSRILVSPDFLL